MLYLTPTAETCEGQNCPSEEARVVKERPFRFLIRDSSRIVITIVDVTNCGWALRNVRGNRCLHAWISTGKYSNTSSSFGLGINFTSWFECKMKLDLAEPIGRFEKV